MGGSRGRRRRAVGRDGGVDIAPSRQKPVPGDTINTAGEDRVGIFEVATSSALFKSYSIDSGTSLRLRILSQAYQRMRWDSCVIRVVPQAPVTTKGGYVCGFIRDPDDGAVTAAELSAAQGSVTKKWYETAIVPMPRVLNNEWFYTSEGPEPRFVSPGRFWIIGEGAPSDNISVIVTINWRVCLTMPTVEHLSNFSFISNFEGWSSPGHSKIAIYKDGRMSVDASPFLPDGLDKTRKHVWRVPSFIFEYSEGTGDTGTEWINYVIFDPSDKSLMASNDGKNFIAKVWQADVDKALLIPCNSVYKYVDDFCGNRDFRQAPHRSFRSLKISG